LKEVERTLVVEEQVAAAKTRRQAVKSNGLGSPLKKQKVVSPKKDAGKRKSPTQPQRYLITLAQSCPTYFLNRQKDIF
jgi:hypothetical protein